MKKDLEEILNCITSETTIEEVLANCNTTEDFKLIIKNISAMDSKVYPLSDMLKQTVLRLATIAKEFNKEITACYIQKNLNVPYPQALALYEFFKNEVHI